MAIMHLECKECKKGVAFDVSKALDGDPKWKVEADCPCGRLSRMAGIIEKAMAHSYEEAAIAVTEP